MNTSPRDTFYNEVMEETGFSQKRIKAILGGRYNTFEISMLDEYKEVLLEIHKEEQQKGAEERVKNFSLPDPVPCPVCGAPTVGAVEWFGKYTRKPGWKCTEGGIGHFLQNKAKEIYDATSRDTRDT